MMSNRNPMSSAATLSVWLKRCVAAFILAFFLPTMVVASPLHCCVDGKADGSNELVHVEAFAHSASAIGVSPDDMHRALHDARTHCWDGLSLTLTAKSISSMAPGPRSNTSATTHLGFHPRTSVQRRAHSAQQRVHFGQHQRDPRLMTLGTIVLLN